MGEPAEGDNNLMHMSSLNDFSLVRFNDSNYMSIGGLVEESKREGYAFVQRTLKDWENGANHFSGDGESLWGLFSGMELIGIGGLNRDPYVDDAGTGRVRHLYVCAAYRRKGCSSLLMNTIIEWARLHFRVLRLFTDNPAAAVFYERLGFQRVNGYKVSHVLSLEAEGDG